MPCGPPSNLSARGYPLGHAHGSRERHLRRRRRSAPASIELVAAREVLPRRCLGLRREPRCLRHAHPRRGHALHSRGELPVRRCRYEQLHLEPVLDVSTRTRPLRLPGTALLRSLDGGPRSQHRLPRHPRRTGRPQDPCAGRRHRPRDSVELRREQALELSTARIGLALLLAAGALLGAASAAAAPKDPVYNGHRNLVGTPFVPQDKPSSAQLTEHKAIAIVLADPKVADWVGRYPQKGLTKEASLDEKSAVWSVKVWSDLPDAGQIVDAKVDDETAAVTEAWTGPQVAWKMARGYKGAFGRGINDPWIWLTLCVVFLLGLADLRRIVSVRNLDLLVLLSFSFSLYFFNIGHSSTARRLVSPPLLYLLGRMLWAAWRGRGSRSRPLWPAWVLLAGTVFLLGFRVGLNVQDSNVIDVGLAGIDGGQRIVQGEMPYGHMPTDDGKACGAADSEGYVREHIQTNGRCESSNERGDTYGPVSYLAYVPAYSLVGFDGKWNGGSSTGSRLPAAHLTSLLWDLLALIGMGVLGLRFGGRELGATLAFAWAAYPFTQYVSSSNTNDAIMPALLIFGFWLSTSAWARGAFVALSGWTKFASLVVAPLWLTYPGPVRRPRPALAFAAGFGVATLVAFSVLLLDAHPIQAAETFYDRTLKTQITRESPFSLWDWSQYHARGIPDLHVAQWVLEGLLVVGAIAVAFVP